MPRLYRQQPLQSIWEGSGNVICLDGRARAPTDTRDAGRLRRRVPGGSGAPTAGSTSGWRRSSASWATTSISRDKPDELSSRWRSRFKRRYSCGTATRLSPTRSARHGSGVTAAWPTGRCPTPRMPPRSSTATAPGSRLTRPRSFSLGSRARANTRNAGTACTRTAGDTGRESERPRPWEYQPILLSFAYLMFSAVLRLLVRPLGAQLGHEDGSARCAARSSLRTPRAGGSPRRGARPCISASGRSPCAASSGYVPRARKKARTRIERIPGQRGRGRGTEWHA